MSWSRVTRISLVVGVWAIGLYAIAVTVFQFLKSRRKGVQLPEQATIASEVARELPASKPEFYDVPILPGTTHRTSRVAMQRNLLLALSAVLLAAVVAVLVVPGIQKGSTTQKNIVSAPANSGTQMQAGLRTSSFEAGIVTPQWHQADAYGPSWQSSLQDIKTQTGAGWIEFSLLFSQASSSSTTVLATESTPLVTSFATGIRQAHAKGFRVFVVPLMTVNEPGGWAGGIKFSNEQDEQKWFDSYWNTFQPYVQAAAQEGADQLAIATECSWLQQNAPASLWNQLIDRIRSVFTGTLTYDMNWYPLDPPIPSWYSNQNISMIGVSSYIPLITAANRVDPSAMPDLWRDKVKSILDNLSTKIGKPVLISEIGYRNTSDALYDTWVQDSTLPVDNDEQSGAYSATLTNAVPDQHIAGIFCWGWEDVGRFTLKGQPVVSVLYKWFTAQ